jgi:serine/threonine-protein kinase
MAETMPDPLIDQVLDGRYRVVRKLGTGGMATVYLAEDQELGRRVAIKLLDERHAQDAQFVERFRSEAKNAAVLSHPNIVSIYDRGAANGTYYIAMEYLEGKTLKELLVERGPTPIRVAIDYMHQILAALAFAHRNGIVHRDIKPHNVVVGPDGRVKVTDFGIARTGASELTEAGSIIGTAQYLSPEQARGVPAVPASDLYSAGIVLYEMLTGTVPYTGDTPLEIAMKHLSATPEAPSVRRDGIPHDLDLVALRALAKDPDERYGSAEEMDADLARIAGGKSVASETAEAATAVLAGLSTAPTEIVARPRGAAPPAPPTRIGRRLERREERPRRRALWPWIVALVLLGAAGYAGYYIYDKVQNELAEAKPVTVPAVEGRVEQLARKAITAEGLRVRVVRRASDTVPAGQVFEQDPAGGEKLDKGNTVTLVVSTGKPRVTVPNVRDKSLSDAVAALTSARLKYQVAEVHSEKSAGTITAQSPPPGERVLRGTTVRINVSKGLKPIEVPEVIDQPYETAASTLAAAGFAVESQEVESEKPVGIVVDMEPAEGTLHTPGTTVVLSVSTGPQTVPVPDVINLDRPTAASTLRASGFKVSVSLLETTDLNLDGLVISQSPSGGSEAKPKTTVVITVGKYIAPPPAETVPTITVPTNPSPPDTIPTDTVPTGTTPTEPFPIEPPPPSQ